ncbi:MAG TPA: SUMF1/EgtB/PvdO family nonheme iron enzyme [Armatimonadota bacterium]|nr:SUMF1/EgtB/PvdO family nonheme iron enzyme [Armatimonadota bacterium]
MSRPLVVFLSVLFVVSVLSVQCFANITIDTVPVGDPGNAPDIEVMNDGTTGYGSVGYAYNMGKYEVTAGQYTEFLNAVAATDTYGLYNASMWGDSYGCKIQRAGASGSYTYSVASDRANRPVNHVNFWDACRFANWLHNGQPAGLQNSSTTEDGAYAINGYNGDDGRTIQRKPGAKWFLPGEDEWYKAAYYKGGGTNAGYWDYPTASNTLPSNQLVDPDPGNNATYSNNGYTIGSPYYRTEVGAHENSDSPYGIFDQGGNVWEWNEAIVQDVFDSYRGVRGGSFLSFAIYDPLSASTRSYYDPSAEYDDIGFRVCAVPEPSSLLILAGGIGMILGMRRRMRI